jgi:hypothetical protein
MDFDDVAIAEVVVAPDPIENDLSGEHLPRMGEEELGRSNSSASSIAGPRKDLTGVAIEREVAESQRGRRPVARRAARTGRGS